MFSLLQRQRLIKFAFKYSKRKLSSRLEIEKLGNVTTIGINIPEDKNCLDEETYAQLCSALKSVENDEVTTACAIYGIGGNFCTGCTNNFCPDPYKLVSNISKPLVAGITGYATGFGFELALLCDLRVIENTAQIGFNSVPQTLSSVFYQRLVDSVGLAVALDLCLSARNLSAKEAFQYGLAQRIVDCGTGIGQAVQLAKTVGKFPAPILKQNKEAIYSALCSTKRINYLLKTAKL